MYIAKMNGCPRLVEQLKGEQFHFLAELPCKSVINIKLLTHFVVIVGESLVQSIGMLQYDLLVSQGQGYGV